jgi:ADP-ribose pyrophosphatase YjhB (NUDIX family)
MSNIVNLPPNKKDGLYRAPSHEDGGVQVIIERTSKVEVEGMEWHFCREVFESKKIYDFKDKTNLEILTELFRDASCTFVQGQARQSDFIMCKLVVLDEKKRSIKGTAKEIINTLQSEKACKMTSDAQQQASKDQMAVSMNEQGGNLQSEDQPTEQAEEIGYGAGIAIVLGDSILLTHPTKSKWHYSYSIPKGKMEEGEGFLEGALRETKEEVGITLSEAQVAELKSQFPTIIKYVKKKGVQTKLAYYVLRINDLSEIGLTSTRVPQHQLQIEEVDWAGFVKFEEAKATRLVPLQVQIVEAIEGAGAPAGAPTGARGLMGADGFMLAPNGKKSNLTPEQWKLVRTPEFKAWFGDFELSPETSSKVVDENGEPLVVWHGTKSKFYEFTKSSYNGWYFFTDDKERAEMVAEFIGGNRVMPVFLSIKNPVTKVNVQAFAKKNKATDIENDGATQGNPASTFIVKDSNQIKLADGSNTTFDGGNADVRMEAGGTLDKVGTTKADKQVREYLNMMIDISGRSAKRHEGYHYHSLWDFVNQEGRFYKSQELTEEEMEYVIDQIEKLSFIPQMKQCFYNAQMLAINDVGGKIKYVEGYAYAGLMPADHGWNTINGKVIDITWRKGERWIKPQKLDFDEMVLGSFDGDERSYYGVEIQTKEAMRVQSKHGIACSLIDNMYDKHILLKEKFGSKKEDVGQMETGGDVNAKMPDESSNYAQPNDASGVSEEVLVYHGEAGVGVHEAIKKFDKLFVITDDEPAYVEYLARHGNELAKYVKENHWENKFSYSSLVIKDALKGKYDGVKMLNSHLKGVHAKPIEYHDFREGKYKHWTPDKNYAREYAKQASRKIKHEKGDVPTIEQLKAEAGIKEAGGDVGKIPVIQKGGEIVIVNPDAIESVSLGKISVKAVMETGGNLPNNEHFGDSEKNGIFVPSKITKHELQSIISGKSKVSNGDTIQTALAYIRREKGSNSINRRTESGIEEERLIEFVDKNNLWYAEELNTNNSIGGGSEHIVYPDLNDKDFILKINNLNNYASWSDYLINLLLNNTFFPDTSYELVGFKKNEQGNVFPVVRQYFVARAIIANLKDVQRYLFSKGFTKVHPLVNAYRSWDLGIMIGDLHDRNVLLKDDVLFFIDTKFFISHNVDYVYSNGGSAEVSKQDWSEDHKATYELMCGMLNNESMPIEERAGRLIALYENDLIPHFQKEERETFSVRKDETSLELYSEHLQAHQLIDQIRELKREADMKAFCRLLKQHIQKEEKYFHENP